MSFTSQEIHLTRRPEGWPVPEDFATVTVEIPDPGPEKIVVRNTFLSVDPYMRGRMNDVPSYVPPYQLDEPMEGGAIGVVEASGSDKFAVGTHVLHNDGWREYSLVDAAAARAVDPSVVPSTSLYLGGLGMPALTAYVGLLDYASLKPGDTVFVSGAAGAVGQAAGQIARLKGAKRVIGSAGSQEKIDFLVNDLGYDAAFNYRDGSVNRQLRQAAPDGVDVYFDNVGGDHLEAAIGAMNLHGRITMCGAIAQYNATEPPAAPRNLALFIGKRLTMRGMLVLDDFQRMPAFVSDVSGWLASGDYVARETVVDGIDHTVDAFLGMLRGENVGKMVVKVLGNWSPKATDCWPLGIFCDPIRCDMCMC
ncbi:MAG TPA: NADP-dependent oxidoreductase [Stackebrandtia sp.]|jgi:NADPH-dependent curcumin reductase CurA|uniref:NADP-dependent oxidoreductase n=1 Tax=Stackebrandtia sp. TaxID=2023065 RepID=UPI002D31D996|nr:NADP-dependent oxidoreductase [Stackebrandtia sp.]HZE37394.1 NADP-dependent oxidoreductase [Stackebrandtia sp.]